MRRAGALIGALIALGLLAWSPLPVAAVEYPCAAGAVQIEDQAWWQDKTGEPWPGRHIHQQLCWPTGAVNGRQTYRTRVLLHHQPPGARITRMRMTDGGGGNVWSKTTGFPTIDAAGNASFFVDITFDASSLSSGAHEMRLATIVRQPSGVDQFVSSGHLLWVRQLSGGTDRRYHEARGWYPLFKYLNSRTRTALGNFRTMAAGEQFHAQCASPSGENATRCGLLLDPDVHDGSWGTPILPWVNGEASRTATFPSGVAPGLHRVMIHADSRRDLGGVSNGTNSSSFVITVLVP